jgi:hypothetical protein
MSDNTERPDSETPPSTPRADDAAAGGNGQTAPHDPREELRRTVTRLTPEQKAALLAELPPPEEMERMYRELQEKGGLSFEEFFEPLLREFGSQP